MKHLASLLVATGLFLGALPTHAAKVPNPGQTDHRIRQVNYNPLQVYKITGYYGYALTVLFEKDEQIQQVIMGDQDGWQVVTKNHVLSLKPKALQPDTSMVVLTNKREYTFDVRTKKPRRGAAAQAMDEDQAFLVRFAYPKQQAERAAAAAALLRAQAEEAKVEAGRLEAERLLVANLPAKPINRDYTYTGSAQLAPLEMWDDGQFTYLRFSAQQGIPAIYTVSGDGNEIIAPKHFDRDVTVIQKLSRKLVLRRGLLVTCLWNEGPTLQTQQTTNGSSDPASSRLIKPIPEPKPAKMPVVTAPPKRTIVTLDIAPTEPKPKPDRNIEQAPPARQPAAPVKPTQRTTPRKRTPEIAPSYRAKREPNTKPSKLRIPIPVRTRSVPAASKIPTAQPVRVPSAIIKPALLRTVE